MVSDDSNESYFTDGETTMNMSFQSAMRQADRAEGMTPFKEIPEHLIERTQTGKVINVRPPSPNSPTAALKIRFKDLETELDAKERQAIKKKQEYHDRLTTLETRLYELEQQQSDLESAADEWKIKYERQKEIADEYLKIADDREMEEVTQPLSKLAAETFKLRNDLKLRDEANTLQNESKGHQKRADEAENKREEAAKVARDLRDLVATEGKRLKNEIKKVTEENKNVSEDFQKATKESLKWQNEARRLDTMLTVSELKEKEWQQQIAQQKQENIKVTNELYEMTRTVMNKDDEVTEVRTQLKSAAEEYQKLEREVTQLAEHINKMEQENEKVMKEKTFQLHDHTQKVKQENTELRRERDELTLRNRRLEDENKALQTSVKYKDEQLLQYGVKTATVESPPPSYSKAHETGKSFHFEMPLRTGTGKGSIKTERNGEKVNEEKEQLSEGYPHRSRDDPSQFPPHIETNVFIDEGRRDRPSSRQERPRKSRYAKAKRNPDEEEGSEEEEDPRGGFALAKALNSMARKTPL
ncbi:uncharacterized protein LOC129589495 [Paramacrobiotus metropolitanus]|uniref:uncharacterized protein LOC129589495 n=1 Tax=Paramacrobiotus metropolitanus TaxID=2943436 RepID=UPI0024457097|nr:uncharacterized protein LOC129589495 [Paramacrobiotus metropolitanus]